MAESKYQTSVEEKISLGPVFAVNPRYVKKIEFVGLGDTSWLNVHNFAFEVASELETLGWCEQTLAEFVRRNPNIEVVRTVVDHGQSRSVMVER